nr:helix-turn-helix transcriptional regulator [Azospirillum sp. TSH58]
MVPNRLADLRQERKMTLKDLAGLVGTSYQQVNRLEKGERPLSDQWAAKFAQALGVETWELFKSPSIANSSADELTRIYEGLDERRRAKLLEYARDMAAAQLAERPAETTP